MPQFPSPDLEHSLDGIKHPHKKQTDLPQFPKAKMKEEKNEIFHRAEWKKIQHLSLKKINFV